MLFLCFSRPPLVRHCKNLTTSFVDILAARQRVHSSPDILAAGLAAMIKTKAFSIHSTSPEHPSVQIVFPQ